MVVLRDSCYCIEWEDDHTCTGGRIRFRRTGGQTVFNWSNDFQFEKQHPNADDHDFEDTDDDGDCFSFGGCSIRCLRWEVSGDTGV